MVGNMEKLIVDMVLQLAVLGNSFAHLRDLLPQMLGHRIDFGYSCYFSFVSRGL